MDLDEIRECAAYFITEHKEVLGRTHPTAYDRTISQLASICDEYGITDQEALLTMMDLYLHTDFDYACDYRIWHFISRGVFVRIGLHAGVIDSIYQS